MTGFCGEVESYIACVAGVQRGGWGEVECEREARSLGARVHLVDVKNEENNSVMAGVPYRAPNDRASRSRRASRSHSTSPLPPLCTPATQAKSYTQYAN